MLGRTDLRCGKPFNYLGCVYESWNILLVILLIIGAGKVILFIV